MSAADIRQKKVLGFAIQRRRESDGEIVWLKGMKTFAAVEPEPAPGVLVSSLDHPFQIVSMGGLLGVPRSQATRTASSREPARRQRS